MVKRASWLSLTPEPERELPQAVATLVCGHRASSDAVTRERRQVERLVLRGSQRRWLSYLHDVVALIDRRLADDDPEVVHARARAAVVIANHHNLLLALPGPGAALTSDDRLALWRLAPDAGAAGPPAPH